MFVVVQESKLQTNIKNKNASLANNIGNVDTETPQSSKFRRTVLDM